MDKYYIYYHRDPRPEYYRWKKYIGKGAGNRAYRLNNRHSKHKKWLNRLKSLNLSPIIEIVEYFKNEEKAYNKEIELIKKYKDRGYNLCNTTNGGDGVRGLCGKNAYWYGKKRSKEVREKMSKARKGKKLSKETCEKMSKARIGNTSRVGKKMSERSKKQISNTLMGNTHRRRAIICVNNSVIYESVVKACDVLKLDNRSVHRVLKGEYSHTKGYKFEYTK